MEPIKARGWGRNGIPEVIMGHEHCQLGYGASLKHLACEPEPAIGGRYSTIRLGPSTASDRLYHDTAVREWDGSMAGHTSCMLPYLDMFASAGHPEPR